MFAAVCSADKLAVGIEDVEFASSWPKAAPVSDALSSVTVSSKLSSSPTSQGFDNAQQAVAIVGEILQGPEPRRLSIHHDGHRSAGVICVRMNFCAASSARN